MPTIDKYKYRQRPWSGDLLTDRETPIEKPYLNRQCFAKLVVSSTVHSPFGFSFMAAHHFLLPTLGEQAASNATIPNKSTKKRTCRIIVKTASQFLRV